MDFPPLPSPGLSLDEVIRYLTALHANGHEVRRDQKHANIFFLVFDDLHRIRISVNRTSGKGQVQLLYCEEISDHRLRVVESSAVVRRDNPNSRLARRHPSSELQSRQSLMSAGHS